MKEVAPSNKVLWQNFWSTLCLMMHSHRKLCVITICLWSLRGALSLLIPISSAIVLEQLQMHMNETQLPLVVIGWIIFQCVFQPTYRYFCDLIWLWYDHVESFFKNGLFKKIFDVILKMPPIVLEGQQATKVVTNIGALNKNITDMMEAFFRGLAFFVPWFFAGIILLKEKAIFAAIVFTCWFFAVVIERLINKHFSRDGELEKWRVQNEAEKADQLDNLVNIGALNIQDQVLQEVHEKMEKYTFASLKVNLKLQLIKYISGMTAGIFPIVICNLMAAADVLKDHELGHFVLITGMVSEMVVNGNILVWCVGRIARKTKAYHKLLDTLSYDHNLDLKVGRRSVPYGGRIELKKITFAYPDRKIPVLKDLSLKIRQGDRVAIIGNSGMGKSTLINVMQHAYEVQAGEVLINDQNVQKATAQSLKQIITYMNQHPVFWTQKNIRENLLVFNPKATDVELYQALNAAGLLDEITCKEKGIESKVTSLSAGQKQRLALTRAFLRQTPIIIMDEPTANLDTLAQTKVLEGIKNLSKVKGHKPTVVFASNVPAEIASANRILLLENGKIVEDGSPKKLMENKNSKVYKRLKRYVSLFQEG